MPTQHNKGSGRDSKNSLDQYIILLQNPLPACQNKKFRGLTDYQSIKGVLTEDTFKTEKLRNFFMPAERSLYSGTSL